MPRFVPTLISNLPWPPRFVTSRATAILLASAAIGLSQGAGSPSVAGAQAYLPPRHELFAGVAGQPLSAYVQAVGKHPAVYQVFAAWGEYLPAIFQDAAAAHARLMIHITTASGGHEAITPAGIANGGGDGWLIALNEAMAAGSGITYIRLMSEMDGSWNPYSAYNADGSSRGAAHSAAAFRRAWQRVTLIMHGGTLNGIDAELRRLGLPKLRSRHDLPRASVAMLWVPQVAGAPDIPGNRPRDYWPGSRWVDWVGTDFYGNAPNFAGLTALYDAFPRQPFVFGEYALWGSDDPGFIRQLFSWVHAHGRTRMMIYNLGLNPRGPFRLWRYPHAARELRRLLASSQFPAYAPEYGR
jgi:hypothetical protein